MKYLLIRHGKTDANRLTRAAYGVAGAPLNQEGVEQAKALQEKLKRMHIDVEHEEVAVSELLRTSQTAEYAGFKMCVPYKVLNEVTTADPVHTQELISKGILPDEAVIAAKRLLAAHPTQKIWITHGLVIAAVRSELSLAHGPDLIPGFCEVIEINL